MSGGAIRQRPEQQDETGRENENQTSLLSSISSLKYFIEDGSRGFSPSLSLVSDKRELYILRLEKTLQAQRRFFRKFSQSKISNPKSNKSFPTPKISQEFQLKFRPESQTPSSSSLNFFPTKISNPLPCRRRGFI